MGVKGIDTDFDNFSHAQETVAAIGDEHSVHLRAPIVCSSCCSSTTLVSALWDTGLLLGSVDEDVTIFGHSSLFAIDSILDVAVLIGIVDVFLFFLFLDCGILVLDETLW